MGADGRQVVTHLPMELSLKFWKSLAHNYTKLPLIQNIRKLWKDGLHIGSPCDVVTLILQEKCIMLLDRKLENSPSLYLRWYCWCNVFKYIATNKNVRVGFRKFLETTEVHMW